MNLEEFKIGGYFRTGSGRWICADIGSKCIVAVKEVAGYPMVRHDLNMETGESKKLPDGFQTWEEITKDLLVYGHCEVFHLYDMDGCVPE